ncbi:uncharacterized protein LOC123683230 [Harmonia axyridis]|uniref:uncharacterized protein LOC123683230 n=1 Tax=Harmonia axyridis TaxID=115357 RepID=UPI001E278D43|nr:uncharacterized protein LOC123683230 [Harmonia axyridis]
MVEQVREFTYLGADITSDGDLKRETAIRPIITYATETRPDTARTTQMMSTTEMRIIRRIHGKTLLDRVRNEELREQSGIQDVGKLVKEARHNKPTGKRTQGRPPKRWKECCTSTSEEAD